MISGLGNSLTWQLMLYFIGALAMGYGYLHLIRRQALAGDGGRP